MSARKRKPARKPLPWITLAIACAGLTALVVKYYFSESKPPITVSQEAQIQGAAPAISASESSTGPAVTNELEFDGVEERVVALVVEGNEFLAQGNHAEAARKYEQAVAMSPDQEDLHYNLGIALARMGKTEDAKKQYEEALEIFPDYAEAHNNLGNLLMNENKLDEAVDRFQEAIKILPEDAVFHNNLGTAFGRQGKVAEAMAEFQEAVRLNPAYAEARVNLANAFLSSGQTDEAVTQLNEALRLKPGFKPALQTMQRVRQRQVSTTAEE